MGQTEKQLLQCNDFFIFLTFIVSTVTSVLYHHCFCYFQYLIPKVDVSVIKCFYFSFIILDL